MTPSTLQTEAATRPVFPFTALVGQPLLQRALLLAAIDPAIGGVLIGGPRGTAKSTAARGLAALMPEAPFVTLPLAASLEQLVGTLDIEDVLRDGTVRLAPGLLARAHGGVLYVDEVNLLPDALVDALLDAAASGIHTVERDGISQQHAARFVLVGTMNPEEGELRPQLLDRFGLSVALANPVDPAQRQAILRARLDFDDDPRGFEARHRSGRERLMQALAAARAALPGLGWPDAVLQRAAVLAQAAAVDGLRADLVMLRAARALAAFEGRPAVGVADVEAVAELALAHRRAPGSTLAPPHEAAGQAASPPHRPGPPREPARAAEPQAEQASSAGRAPAASAGDRAGPRDPDPPASTVDGPRASAPAAPAAEGDWGALPPRPEPTRRVLHAEGWPAKSLSHRSRRSFDEAGGARWPTPMQQPDRLPSQRLATSPRPGPAIDWPRTLVAKAAQPLTREHLRHRPVMAAAGRLHLIVLDASGSMRRGGRLALAKGLAMRLIDDAARAGDDVALIGFGGRGVELLLKPGRARAAVATRVRPIGGGGGTPLAEALSFAQRLLQAEHRRRGPGERWLWLLSDGRTLEQPSAPPAAGRIVVVDFDDPQRAIGRCAAWAARWGAAYRPASALAVAPPSGSGPSPPSPASDKASP